MNKVNAFLLAVFFASPALAQSSKKWVEPASGFLGSVELGLIDIGGGVAGIAIIGYAFFLFINGRIEAMKLFTMVLAALLVTAGPSMIRGLLSVGS